MGIGNETLYRLFVIVADEKSITKASEKLYISQPAVSKQIKKLELIINTPLFNRKNMELTRKGKELYDRLKPLMIELEKVEQSYEINRSIKLGTYNTMMSKLLSSCITDYYEKYKENNVIIENSNLEEMFEKLNNYELDIVIVKKTDFIDKVSNNNLKYIKLGELEDILICDKNIDFGKHRELNLLDKKILYLPRNNSNVIEYLMEVLKEKNINPIIKRVDSSTMINLVKGSSNIGLITKEYINEELKKGEVKELSLKINIPKSEFGIYITEDNRFMELNNFIKIIKHNFKL